MGLAGSTSLVAWDPVLACIDGDPHRARNGTLSLLSQVSRLRDPPVLYPRAYSDRNSRRVHTHQVADPRPQGTLRYRHRWAHRRSLACTASADHRLSAVT